MQVCSKCEKPIPDSKKNYVRIKYCSKECREENRRLKYVSVNKPIYDSICTGTVGAIHELLVSVDLLKRGFDVFRSLSPSCSCDLAILKNRKLIKVEVTTGKYSVSGKLFYPPKKDIKYDLLAVVVKHGDIIYLPTLEAL